MDYEFKSILLSTGSELTSHNSTELNQYFNKGWEYVDSICQSISRVAHGYSDTKYGNVIVILRKKKETISL